MHHDYGALHRFHSTTRPKLTVQEKVLRTIFTFQFENGRPAPLAEVVRRCHYFANRPFVKLCIEDLIGGEQVGFERIGRTFVYRVEYEGFQDLENMMRYYNEEHVK